MSDDDERAPGGEPVAEGRGFRTKRIRVMNPTPPSVIPPGLAEVTAKMRDSLRGFDPADIPPIDLQGPAVRSANAAERTAGTIAEMRALTETMVQLSQESLAASESARADATRSEKSAKFMSWISTGIAIASLAAAIVAIVVTAAATSA